MNAVNTPREGETSPAYSPTSPEYSPVVGPLSPLFPVDFPFSPGETSPQYSPLPHRMEAAPAAPTLMESARLRTAWDSVQKFGGTATDEELEPAVFEIDLNIAPVEAVWEFVTKHYASKKWLECAKRLMRDSEPYRRPYLCKAILESAGSLSGMLQDPTRDDLQRSLVIINLCKFASEEWLALPEPKRRRTESPERA